MKIGNLLEFEIHVPTTGGKAGRGKAQTGSIQVRKDGVIKAQFRFRWISASSRRAAIQKAKDFCYDSFKQHLEVI